MSEQGLGSALNTFILARLAFFALTPTARPSARQCSTSSEASVPPLLVVHRRNFFSAIERV
jgi:hypothetical protein